jgi:hypothetical protein
MKAGTGGDYVVLRRADSALCTVRILDIRVDKFPSQVHFGSQLQKWVAELVVHPDGVNRDPMSSEELDCSL